MSHPLIDRNARLVYQGIDVVRSLPEGSYRAEPRPGSAAPALGPHFRHCLDFYLCFLDGLKRDEIDYDRRARRPEVERDPERAIAELVAVAERLARLDARALERRIGLRREDPENGAELLESTVGRELQFLASHTVHHYALIAMALRLEGHPVPTDFGVAPSTLEHWRREGRVAR